ncbi:hypothetical protein I3760_11G073300 [Carya illinoinensis]|nr:hypothetical protein I3760_11G073300 [Carya illinoinensis]
MGASGLHMLPVFLPGLLSFSWYASETTRWARVTEMGNMAEMLGDGRDNGRQRQEKR